MDSLAKRADKWKKPCKTSATVTGDETRQIYSNSFEILETKNIWFFQKTEKKNCKTKKIEKPILEKCV